MHRCGNVSKTEVDAIVNYRLTSCEEYAMPVLRRKDFVTTNAPMASSAISRSIRWDYHFTHCTKANITDDQGLIELLSHNLTTFAPSQSTFQNHYSARPWLSSRYPSESTTSSLSASDEQKRFQLAPKPTKAERAAQGKTGLFRWRHDGSLNGRMLGWRDVRA